MRLPITATLPNDADSISGVLDHGFELYARSFSRTWGFIALSSLPNAALGLVVGELQGSFASMAAGGALTGHIPGGPGLTILVGALAFALLVDVRSDRADVVDPPVAPH